MLILDIISWENITDWWPLLVILIGIGILAEWTRSPFISRKDTDTVDMLAILGDVNSASDSANFRGGYLTSVLGDVKLDLRDSKIEERPVEIHIIAILGNIDIKVTENWNIKIDVLSILGVVKDKRLRSSMRKEYIMEKLDLIVTGFTALGDVSIND